MKEKVTIEKFDYEGNGITKINNIITFVSDALPKEDVEVSIIKNNKSFNNAIVKKYITKSQRRIENPCEYKCCGGCDLLHIDYNYELEFKENKICEIFLKQCNLTCINKIVPSPKIFNYRNKISLKIKDNKLGLFEKNSNTQVNINKCLLVNDKINNIILELNKISLNNIDEIIIKNMNETMLIIKGNKINKDLLKNINVNNIIIIDNKKEYLIKGKKYIEEKLNNIKYIVSPESFFQINKEQTINLYNKVIEVAEFNKNDTVLDLYCGTGTISLYIASYVKKVYGIEINKVAIDDANKNKKLNNILNVEFICQNANKINININFNPDIIIVDPPRNGLDNKTKDIIKNLNSKKLIYISCNPLTLARDINYLKNLYNIKSITPFDMFPKTHHVECIALLTRK